MGRVDRCLWAVCAAVMSPANAHASDPNDPDFGLQWGFRNVGQIIRGLPGVAGADVGVTAARAIHEGTSSVTVAIVGRGVDPHPEFADRLLEGRAFVGDLFDSRDTCPSDTHVAGIVAASTNNGTGVAGLNGLAWLLPVRVFDSCIGEPSAAAEGIRWAVDQGATVVLVPIQFDAGSAALFNSLQYASANDVVVIAPVGSAGNPSVTFPAAYPSCIAVAATTNDDFVSASSNHGAEVDLSAPGRDIWSTWTNDGYAFQVDNRDAISAAAFVAGAAALIRSYAPETSAIEVRRLLVETAVDRGAVGWDEFFGHGRLDVAAGLSAATAPALRWELVEPLPQTLTPNSVRTTVVRIVSVAEEIVAGSATLFYRNGPGAFSTRPLTPIGQDIFAVEFPDSSCGEVLEYYLSVEGSSGTVVTHPLSASTELHRSEVVVRTPIFDDDFETDRGWSVVGGENTGSGTKGRWTRVAPVATTAQPGFDRSPNGGTLCYVTGQHFGGSDGTNDVDGGPMILTSPMFSLAVNEAEISYACWFKSLGSGVPDTLFVEVSRDGGTTWHLVEAIDSTPGWERRRFRLSDIPDAVGDQLQIRFQVSDSPSDSVTEAAIDEVHIDALACALARGDANGDGVINLGDFGALVDCLAGPARPALGPQCQLLDFDGNGRLDLKDYRELAVRFDMP